jgi:hypothetical protein
VQDALDAYASGIASKQDQIPTVNRHSDPRTEIITRRIRARNFRNALTMRFQFVEKGYRSRRIVAGDVIPDLF